MPVSFMAVDALAVDGEVITNQPYRARRRLLEGLRFEGRRGRLAASNPRDTVDASLACVEAGLEGPC